jgi:hypothetical protein
MKADRTLIESLAQAIYDHCNTKCGMGSRSNLTTEPFDIDDDCWEVEFSYTSTHGIVYHSDIVVHRVYSMPDGYNVEREWSNKDINKLNEVIAFDI